MCNSRVGYLSLLQDSKTRTVFFSALFGRLSFAMVTLALLLGIEAKTGSFAAAGISTGCFGLANVVASPYRARMVDRWGQKLVLNSLAFVYGIGLLGMALLVSAQTVPVWVFFVLSALVGLFVPPLGAAMRVLWAIIAPNVQARTRAYSLDAVAEELIFTTGPVVISVVVAVTNPAAGLVLSAFSAIIGTVGMTSGAFSQKVLPTKKVAPKQDRPVKQSGFILMLFALFGSGIVLGFIEVTAPAFAIEKNSSGLSGLLLAAFAAGSALGGLVYGHFTWKNSLERRLLVICFLMAILCGALIFATNMVVLGVGLFVVGVFLAPSLITGYLLADRLTSVEVKTEASSWVNTAVNAGAALAAAAAGIIVDVFSTRISFVFAASAALVCLICALPLLAKLRTITEEEYENSH